jgi:hypothetical protein
VPQNQPKPLNNFEGRNTESAPGSFRSQLVVIVLHQIDTSKCGDQSHKLELSVFIDLYIQFRGAARPVVYERLSVRKFYCFRLLQKRRLLSTMDHEMPEEMYGAYIERSCHVGLASKLARPTYRRNPECKFELAKIQRYIPRMYSKVP